MNHPPDYIIFMEQNRINAEGSCLFELMRLVQRQNGVMIRCRSISTVEGSGATCTRNFFEFFFKTGDLSMVQLTQKIQKISKK